MGSKDLKISITIQDTNDKKVIPIKKKLNT